MKYLSVCSGIEAATVAWRPLGWECVGLSEVDPFASAVLATRIPEAPNFGDINAFASWPDFSHPDVLIGGTPCQSFSQAGTRAGLADPRGDLTLRFFSLVDELRPRWLVWENVPGLLSLDGGRTFSSILGTVEECGYGYAWRILDAQYFGVPQRRRRIYLVGRRGEDWRGPCQVLFDGQGCCWDLETGRPAGKDPQAGAPEGAGADGPEELTADVSSTLQASPSFTARGTEDGFLIPELAAAVTVQIGAGSAFRGDFGPTGRLIPEKSFSIPSAYSLGVSNSDGAVSNGLLVPEKASPLVANQGTPRSKHGDDSLVPETSGTIIAEYRRGGFHQGRAPDSNLVPDISATVTARKAERTDNRGGAAEAMLIPDETELRVRRFTPEECEELQGFPRGWTAIPWKGRDVADCPEGPRYRCAGNSMAVPVVRWIGERIEQVQSQEKKT